MRGHACIDRVWYPWGVLADITGIPVKLLRQRYWHINHNRKHKDTIGMSEITRPHKQRQLGRHPRW